MSQTTTPFVLINPFKIESGKVAEFEEGWKACAEFLQKQDGYIKTSLHKAIDCDKAHFQFVNVALWENPVKFQTAIKAMNDNKITDKINQVHHECFPALYKVHIEMWNVQ